MKNTLAKSGSRACGLLFLFFISGSVWSLGWDDIKNAGSVLKDTITGNAGNKQQSPSIKLWPARQTSAQTPVGLPLSAALAETVTDIKIEDSAVRCPPFGKDDTWRIRRTAYLSNGMTNSSEITDTITYADKKTVKYRRSGSDSMEQEDEYRIDHQAIFLVKSKMQSPMGEVVISYKSDIPVCPLPEVGEIFTGKGWSGGKQSGEITITVEAINPFFVEVTVPAGTFKTRRIDLKTVIYSQETGRQETSETIYFAERVGVVKEIVRFSGNFEVYDLLEYKF